MLGLLFNELILAKSVIVLFMIINWLKDLLKRQDQVMSLDHQYDK
jgi:hypothetical protein